MTSAVLEGNYVQYAQYNFENTSIELGRAQWPNYDDQHYLRGCKWSPDGTCLLTVVRGGGMHVMELPSDLYTGDSIMTSRPIQALMPAVSVPEGGLIYDYCWYPGMNSSTAATCCWAATGHEGPIHLWDAFTGELRCSYRGYNNVDELEAAISVTFSADGQNIFCGYKKNVKIFSTGRPGREYVEYPVTHPAACLTASLAQPGVVAIVPVEDGYKRAVLHFLFSCGESATKINSVHGEHTISVRTAQKWFKKFQVGESSIDDEPRSGRPVNFDDDILRNLVE